MSTGEENQCVSGDSCSEKKIKRREKKSHGTSGEKSSSGKASTAFTVMRLEGCYDFDYIAVKSLADSNGLCPA